MDIFDEEMLNYWRCLNKCGVRYIMVGGVATYFNGFNRITDDIDVWLEDTPVNRDNYRKAFHIFDRFFAGRRRTHLVAGQGLDRGEQRLDDAGVVINQ